MISMPDVMINRFQEGLEKIIRAYIRATRIKYHHVESVFNVILNDMKERDE
jgi:hypothetical protein